MEPLRENRNLQSGWYCIGELLTGDADDNPEETGNCPSLVLMYEHHTKNKGDLGVLKAQVDLFEKGYLILNPATEHAPFDLVAYKAGRFIRVQVKYRGVVNGRIEVPFKTTWADRNGTHTHHYDKGEVDVVCLYCPDTDKCNYIDVKLFQSSVTLRVEPPKNGQKANVHFADDYCQVP
jgi:hypothetical protein